MDYSKLTNAELNIEMKKLENQYENIKLKTIKMIEEMKSLNDSYIEAKKEINKRKQFF